MKKFIKIIIPRVVQLFLELVENIIAKHTADGASSKLNGLNMADMTAKFNFALEKSEEAEQHQRDRKEAVQQRNNALGLDASSQSFNEGTLLYFLTSIRNHLLGIFRNNEQSLGKWGFDVQIDAKDNVKVIIPRSPIKMIALGKRVLKKHEDDDTDSLLNEFDMVAFKELLDHADEQHKLAKDLHRLMKLAYRERNLAMGFARRTKRKMPGTLMYYATSARDVLLGNFRNNEHTLGLWGFEVITTIPSSPTDPTPPDFEVAEVSGMVVNSASTEGLAEVEVKFTTSQGQFTAITNPIGVYNIDLQLPEAELVVVEIHHPGFHPLSEPHMLVPSEQHMLDFSLNPA